MHCLPAYKGNEITAHMFDDPHARMYQQAENRLHVQIMVTLLGV
jgi:ornithine carbamoyltransferase